MEDIQTLIEELEAIKGLYVYVEIHSSISLTHLLGEIQEINITRNHGDNHISQIDVNGSNESITLWVEEFEEVTLEDDLGTEEPSELTEFLFKVTFQDGTGIWFHQLLEEK